MISELFNNLYRVEDEEDEFRITIIEENDILTLQIKDSEEILEEATFDYKTVDSSDILEVIRDFDYSLWNECEDDINNMCF